MKAIILTLIFALSISNVQCMSDDDSDSDTNPFKNLCLFDSSSDDETLTVSHDTKKKRIIMPSKYVLEERLDLIGLKFFIEKSSIICILASQEKTTLDIAATVEVTIEHFKFHFGTPEHNALLNQRKPLIYEVLLKEHPEILNELEEQCFYRPLDS